MTPDDPRHGTNAGAQAHIKIGNLASCPPCHEAHLRYRRRRRKEAVLGKPRRVPTGPVIAHLKRLRNQGITALDIAAQSGVSVGVLDELYHPTRARKQLLADNAAAILATNPPPNPHGRVPALGTKRRIRALARLGWSMRDIAAASDGQLKLEFIRNINSAKGGVSHVEYANASAVNLTYQKLCMKLPEDSRTAAQVRARAIKKGWLPPLAWNDIDDPAEKPTGVLAPPCSIPGCPNGERTRGWCDKHYRRWLKGGGMASTAKARAPHDDVDRIIVDRLLAGERIPSTRAEKDEAMRRWKAAGKSEREFCRIHGWKDSRYGREDVA